MPLSIRAGSKQCGRTAGSLSASQEPSGPHSEVLIRNMEANGSWICRKRQELDLMVTLGRFELPTSGLGNRCSIQLSYRAIPVWYRSLGGTARCRRKALLREKLKQVGDAEQLFDARSQVDQFQHA